MRLMVLAVLSVVAIGCNGGGIGATACGDEGNPCCAATREESLQLPAPTKQQQGVGRCNVGFACATAACAPHSTCDDGLLNDSNAPTYPNFCTPVGQ